jgi:hypothetical protein
MRLTVAVVMIGLIWAYSSKTYAGSEEVVPRERFNQKGPRVLFNLNEGRGNLVEIVPGELYQNFWQGVRMTVIRGHMRTKPNGESVFNFQPGYHGEEFVLLMSGRLTFIFPDTGRSYTLQPGDVFHFNNVLHHGVCETEECEYLGILTPPFDRGGLTDYGDRGADPTQESMSKSERERGASDEENH